MADAFNDKDTMDINELASLNEDISPDLIEQLQAKLAQEAKNLNETDISQFDSNDDATLFEEPIEASEKPVETNSADSVIQDTVQDTVQNTAPETTVNPDKKTVKDFDDNFIKKYKAKLNKQRMEQQQAGIEPPPEAETTISSVAFPESDTPKEEDNNIEEVSGGKITERELTPAQKEYNDSLDYLDGNVKFSKYVIYIDPKNVDFIESLTVKERKNLINKILKEQDDIAMTKKRFRILQTVIKHAVVAVLTLAISIPVIYLTINASLEATINNYRHSQTMFQALYKERGKINNANIR